MIESNKSSQSQQGKNKQHQQNEMKRQKSYQKFKAYLNSSSFEEVSEGNKEIILDKFCQNSLVIMEDGNTTTIYMPAYVRTHFRNMTEMDIQNLSCRFIATMNISFHVGSYSSKNEDEKQKAKGFAEVMEEHLKEKLKVTFQNDFVLNMEEDISTNVSDSDRTIRQNLCEHQCNQVTRIYCSFIITREFKFGLRSDILFFPLQKNDLELVTTLNSIKVSLSESKQLVLRFNCMDLELPNQQQLKKKKRQELQGVFLVNKWGNKQLVAQMEDLYMHENDGKQLTDQILQKQIKGNINNPFFRNIKISFPQRTNSTEFGYYTLVQKDIEIHYTREKQYRQAPTIYECIKDILFCRHNIVNYKDYSGNENSYRILRSQPSAEERSLEDSYCNTIMHIPMLKASLGTIIQLIIPIFFLSFLGLVEFLYSQSTSGDQVRGQKIGSSTLIVATYISFIYAMRTVIPPTPSWSIFQVAVCILAASTILPIIQSIFAGNYQNTQSPFDAKNGFFLAAFIIITVLCSLIVLMLIFIKVYRYVVTKRQKLQKVSMADLITNLTKERFFVWRNAHCYDFMRKKMDGHVKKELRKRVRFEKWRGLSQQIQA